MNVHDTDPSQHPDDHGRSDFATPSRAPKSSFLQMFLEARPPRDDGQRND